MACSASKSHEGRRRVVRNPNATTIPFKEEDVKKYLDGMIEFWQVRSDELSFHTGKDDQIICGCYIDAYQSVRNNLFGKVKE